MKNKKVDDVDHEKLAATIIRNIDAMLEHIVETGDFDTRTVVAIDIAISARDLTGEPIKVPKVNVENLKYTLERALHEKIHREFEVHRANEEIPLFELTVGPGAYTEKRSSPRVSIQLWADILHYREERDAFLEIAKKGSIVHLIGQTLRASVRNDVKMTIGVVDLEVRVSQHAYCVVRIH